jgi:hypothetical protein
MIGSPNLGFFALFSVLEALLGGRRQPTDPVARSGWRIPLWTP